MSFRPYTTKGKEKDSKLGLNNSGRGWKVPAGGAYDSLRNLSIDLPNVAENADFTRTDISVPSPWASIISFDIILKNTDSEFGALRSNAKNEWRALMSIIALRDLLELNLKVRIIDLENDSKGDAERTFYENLLNMKPEKSVFSNNACWNKFVFLELDNNPIAVLSNSTLVCSMNNYTQNSATNKLIQLGLMDSEYNFIDPIKWIGNDIALSLYLDTWLEKIKKQLNSAYESSSDKSAMDMRITTVIDEFKRALNALHTGENKDIYEKLSESLFKFEYKAEKSFSDSYDLLWHTELDSLNLNTEDAIKIIKVKDLNNICFLDALGKGLAKLIKTNENICKKPDGNWNLYDTDSIFLDQMSLIRVYDREKNKYPFVDDRKIGTCIIEEDNGDGLKKVEYQYILPVREEILADINASIIKRTIKVIEGIDNEIIVSLELEGESGNKIPIEKHYPKDSCKKLYNDCLPYTTIWPYVDIRDKDGNNAWKEYYIFYANNPKVYGEKYSYTLKAKCDDYEEKAAENNLSNINDDIIRTVECMPIRPTYLLVTENEENLVGNKTSHSLGILPLPEPQIKKTIDPNIKYIVGFDFGTTATTAFCYKSDESEEEPYKKSKFIKFGEMFMLKTDEITFSDEKKDFGADYSIGNDENGLLLAYSNEAVHRKVLSVAKQDSSESDLCFIPSKYPLQKSYASVYNVNSTNNNIDVKLSLLHGNIIFDQRLISNINELNLKRTLKWGKEPLRQKNLSRYLNQMMKSIVLTLAKEERVGRICWRFSYPTALTKRELENYKKSTTDIVKGIQSSTKVELDSKVEYYSESFASAKVFNSSSPFVCIDIGGGSTDISVWKACIGDNISGNIIQYSIGVASRKIFLAGITDVILCPQKTITEKNSISLSEIQKEVEKRLERDYRSGYSAKLTDCIKKIQSANRLNDVAGNIENFSYLIETMLQTDDEVIKSLISDNHIALNRLVKLLVIGFWGILYHLAKSLGTIKDSLNSTPSIDINFAGNGSKLYSWLRDIDAIDYTEKLEKAFNGILNSMLDSNSVTARFNYQEDALKTETARGLLYFKEDSVTGEPNLKLVNGSDCILKYSDGHEIKFDADKDIGSLRTYYDHNDESVNNAVLEIPNLKSDLEEFIKPINEIIFDDNNELKINLDDELLSNVRSYIGTVIHNNIVSGSTAPTFIVELEALLSAELGYLKRKDG